MTTFTDNRLNNPETRFIEVLGSEIEFELDETIVVNGTTFVCVSENWGCNPTEPESFEFEDEAGRRVTVVNDR